MGIEINAIVELAAAFTDEGQPHAIQESNAAMDVGGGVNQWQPGQLDAASETSAQRIVADSDNSKLVPPLTSFDNRTGNRCTQDITPPFAGIVVVQRDRRIPQSPKRAHDHLTMAPGADDRDVR